MFTIVNILTYCILLFISICGFFLLEEHHYFFLFPSVYCSGNIQSHTITSLSAGKSYGVIVDVIISSSQTIESNVYDFTTRKYISMQ